MTYYFLMLVIHGSRLNRRSRGEGRELPPTKTLWQLYDLLSTPALEPRVISQNTGKYRFQIGLIDVGLYKLLPIHKCRN
jgi:hypothetical protein